MISKESIARGNLVRMRHRESGAVSAQTRVVASAAVADGRAEILDSEGQVIKPVLLGFQGKNKVLPMLAIDPGPQYPFVILPQAPRTNALAMKIR